MAFDLVSALIGLAVGGIVVFAFLRSRITEARSAGEGERATLIAEREAERRHVAALGEEVRRRDGLIAEAHRETQALKAEAARLEAEGRKEREAAAEKLAALLAAEQRLGDAFGKLAAAALERSKTDFLQLAGERLKASEQASRAEIEKLVGPMKEQVERLGRQNEEMEKARLGAYGGLSEQVRSLVETQVALKSETGQLVQALRTPRVRGRWGEFTLRRCVEMAGMQAHCDFVEQETVGAGDGRLRPDLVVKLPGGKVIVVDAKAPLEAFLDAEAAQDDATRRAKLADHARLVRTHVQALGRKAYWDQFKETVDFVVLFLPGENFYHAALAEDAKLFDAGVEEKVYLASPATLVPLLRAVAYGWRQESLAENAQAISDLGRDLYGRIAVFARHMAGVGNGLEQATKSYNEAVGSLETRVLVGARRFVELKAAPEEKPIPLAAPLDLAPRKPKASDQRPPDPAGHA